MNKVYALLICIILISAFILSHKSSKPQLLFYNAYSPAYDEFFIISSDHKLDSNAVVWFDDNAQVVNYTTPYVATIISPYKK